MILNSGLGILGASQPKGISYVVGLTPSLISIPAQNLAAWTLRSSDISAYIGATARVVVQYTSGSSFRGDIQLDDFNIGGNVFDPNVGLYSFQRNSVQGVVSNYSSVTWNALLTGSNGAGLFFRDSSGTPSGSTGNTTGNTGSWYYYAETSGSGRNSIFWLRSGVVTLTQNTFSLYTAQNGTNCGAIEVYLDIIS
tara:strand:+ start:2486 stop:3070 length:585 start_codon:yes stop_codon:yes gene_type:complete